MRVCACVCLCPCVYVCVREGILVEYGLADKSFNVFLSEKGLQCSKYLHKLVYSLSCHTLNSSPINESMTLTNRNGVHCQQGS